MATPTEYPLSPNQQGLWALEQRFPGLGLYNNNGAWRLPADISFPALRRAVERLTERHPAWRTTFSERDGVPFQIVHEDFPIDFREIIVEDGEGADLEEILDAQVTSDSLVLFIVITYFPIFFLKTSSYASQYIKCQHSLNNSIYRRDYFSWVSAFEVLVSTCSPVFGFLPMRGS